MPTAGCAGRVPSGPQEQAGARPAPHRLISRTSRPPRRATWNGGPAPLAPEGPSSAGARRRSNQVAESGAASFRTLRLPPVHIVGSADFPGSAADPPVSGDGVLPADQADRAVRRRRRRRVGRGRVSSSVPPASRGSTRLARRLAGRQLADGSEHHRVRIRVTAEVAALEADGCRRAQSDHGGHDIHPGRGPAGTAELQRVEGTVVQERAARSCCAHH